MSPTTTIFALFLAILVATSIGSLLDEAAVIITASTFSELILLSLIASSIEV